MCINFGSYSILGNFWNFSKSIWSWKIYFKINVKILLKWKFTRAKNDEKNTSFNFNAYLFTRWTELVTVGSMQTNGINGQIGSSSTHLSNDKLKEKFFFINHSTFGLVKINGDASPFCRWFAFWWVGRDLGQQFNITLTLTRVFSGEGLK